MVREHHRRNVRLSAALIAALLAAAAPAEAAAAMDQALTSQPGDAARGAAVALDFSKGDCNACHKFPAPSLPPDAFGDIGPDLTGVGARLSAAQLRQQIVDARAINPDTLMPPFYATSGLTRVDPKYAGRRILTAQEVEDLVVYLETLK
jgi:sulfur-oxidizing protein SoxX